jgi:hypothetical protein
MITEKKKSKIKNDIKNFLDNFLYEINDEYTKEVLKNSISGYLNILEKQKIISKYEIKFKKKELDWIENVFGERDQNSINVEIHAEPKINIELVKVDILIK